MMHKFIKTILFLTFSYSAFATEKPYPFWLAEKNDKKIYILGTILVTGLNAYQCNFEVKNRIASSDLVFMETVIPTNHPLSMADRRALTIGSESEKQDVLNKLPTKDREKVSKIFTNRYELNSQTLRLSNFGNNKLESEVFATFEDLSSQAQDFLINHGFKLSKYNTETFLKEVGYFIYLTAFYDAFYDTDIMEIEVSLFTRSNKIPLKGLDHNDIDLMSEKEFQDKMSKKTTHLVGIDWVNRLVADYKYIKKDFSVLFTGLSELEQQFEGVVKDTLLKNNNNIWVEKINQALNTEENNTIFVAVDILYFLGPDNMIDMLKEAGFSIKKLHCSEEEI